MCKDNEETYTLQGCAPLECAPMPKEKQTGYTLSLGLAIYKGVVCWLRGYNMQSFFGWLLKNVFFLLSLQQTYSKLKKTYHLFFFKMEFLKHPSAQ